MPKGAAGKLEDVAALASLLEALADERRLRMVALLSHGELCVCHLEAALSMPQPDVSRQLAILREAGIVTARRRDRWVHYRLATQSESICRAQLKLLTRTFRQREHLRRDVERLVKTRGPGSCK